MILMAKPNQWIRTNIPNLTRAEAREEGSYWKGKGYDARYRKGQLELKRPNKPIIL